jgi:hypothetical protein
MISIPVAIAQLRSLREYLEHPHDFFAGRMQAWVEIAKTTALSVLTLRQPEGVEAVEWQFQIEQAIDAIGAQMLSAEHTGLLLYLGRDQTTLAGFGDTSTDILAGELTLAQIEAYVQAGLDGDPLGKPDISEEDRARPAIETAFIIQKAIKKGTTQRGDAVKEFVKGANGPLAEEFYVAIRQAWVEVFSVVAFDDFRVWVSERVREFNRR